MISCADLAQSIHLESMPNKIFCWHFHPKIEKNVVGPCIEGQSQNTRQLPRIICTNVHHTVVVTQLNLKPGVLNVFNFDFYLKLPFIAIKYRYDMLGEILLNILHAKLDLKATGRLLKSFKEDKRIWVHTKVSSRSVANIYVIHW